MTQRAPPLAGYASDPSTKHGERRIEWNCRDCLASIQAPPAAWRCPVCLCEKLIKVELAATSGAPATS